MTESKVVDSWAILAWLLDQPAVPQVEVYLQRAAMAELNLVMSWMNVAELYYISVRWHGPERAEEFLQRLPSLPLRVVLPDPAGILAAARIKPAHPIAFGDAFAIALAQAERATVITGDDEVRRCAVVPVDWIGP